LFILAYRGDGVVKRAYGNSFQPQPQP